jgi:hypothetical protein
MMNDVTKYDSDEQQNTVEFAIAQVEALNTETICAFCTSGAVIGTRTRDLHLTKVVLYQLSYNGVRVVPMHGQCLGHRTIRAGDEARTRNPQLGRLMLYQLSYSRWNNLCVGSEGFEPS